MAVTSYHTVNGQIIGETTAGFRTDYLADAMGSVTATTNSSGAIQNSYRYKPYGGSLSKTGGAPDPKQQWIGTRGFRAALGNRFSEYYRNPTFSTLLGMWINEPTSNFWDDDRIFDKVASYRDKCRRQCTQRAWRSPGGRGGAGPGGRWFDEFDPECYSKCLAFELFTERRNVYFKWIMRGKGDIKRCCRAHVLNRSVFYTATYHPWMWLDKDCDSAVDQGEVYGYGPPSNFDKRGSRPTLTEDFDATISGTAYSGKAVYSNELDCSCSCLAAWFESHFGWENPRSKNGGFSGEGRPWSPDRYTIGASIPFIKAAIDTCCPWERSKLDCFRPHDGTMEPWPGRPRGGVWND